MEDINLLREKQIEWFLDYLQTEVMLINPWKVMVVF